MVDLRPDLSIYQKSAPGQLSVGDLLGAVQKGRSMQTDAAKARALAASTDAQGNVDGEKYRALLMQEAGAGRAFIGPEDITESSSMQQTALQTKLQQNSAAAKLVEPLFDLGDKVSHRDLAPIQVRLAGLIGPQRTTDILGPLAKIPDGAPLRNALTDLHNGFLAPLAPTGTAPGVGGGAERRILPGQEMRMAGEGGIPGGQDPTEMKADRTAAITFQDRTAPLINMINEVRKIPPGTLGPWTPELQDIKKRLIQLGVKGIDLEQVDNIDKLQKAMVKYADQVSGGATDARLLQAVSGNPNIKMQEMTVEDLAKVAYAQEAKRVALYHWFEKYRENGRGIANVDYPKWASQHSQSLDARGFLLSMMSDEAQKRLLDSIPRGSAERKKLMFSFDRAQETIADAPSGGWFVPR